MKNLFYILLASLLFISCASGPREYKDLDKAIDAGDFEKAVYVIEKGQRKTRPVYTRKNSVLLFLNKGLLEHYAGDYEASSQSLQTAERLIEEAYTKSITQGFASYIVNDNTRDYPGEDFEDIYINVFNALNYYNRGDLEGALVEIRKLTISNGKLDLLARRHEYIDPKTGANLQESMQNETGVSELPQTKSVNFSNSALARYLSFLFYQGNGDYDSARIEHNQVYRAFNSNKDIYNFPVPGAVDEANNVAQGLARLNILSFTGLSPIKQEERITHYLPFQNAVNTIATFKLPALVRRPGVINRIEVIVEGEDGTESFNLELLEDIGSVIEETFKARYASILIKTYIRTIIKYTTTSITSAVVAQETDSLTGLLVGLTGRLLSDASERADIRMSRCLPEKAFIGGINLDPGTYSVIIKYYSGSMVIGTEEYADVIVMQNRLNLLQSVNLR